MLCPVVEVSVSTLEVRLASLMSPGLSGRLGASHQWPQGTGSWRSESMYCRCYIFPVPVAVGFLAWFHYLGGRSKLGGRWWRQLQKCGCGGQVWLRGWGWEAGLAVVLTFLFFPMPRTLFVRLSLPPRFLPFSCCLFCWSLSCNRCQMRNS